MITTENPYHNPHNNNNNNNSSSVGGGGGIVSTTTATTATTTTTTIMRTPLRLLFITFTVTYVLTMITRSAENDVVDGTTTTLLRRSNVVGELTTETETTTTTTTNDTVLEVPRISIVDNDNDNDDLVPQLDRNDDDETIWDWERLNAIQPAEHRPCPHLISNIYDLGGGEDITVYTRTRNDRSGCVIQHMLQVYAYTWKYGFTYGGGTTEVFRVLVRMRKRHEEMFKTIGLDGIFWFNEPHEMVSNYFLFAGPRCYDHIRIDDPAFINHLNTIRQQATNVPELPSSSLLSSSSLSLSSSSRTSSAENQKTTTTTYVVIHMRRGDANPCFGLEPRLKRYLPNEYYLRVLDEYVFNNQNNNNHDDNNIEVIIFSEKESFESFDIFEQRGYHLELDGTNSEAWLSMMYADILITSPESLFSYIPAIFNQNIVYHDKVQEGFHHWNVISEDIRTESEIIRDQLIKDQCPSYMKLHSCLEENKYPPYNKNCNTTTAATTTTTMELSSSQKTEKSKHHYYKSK